MNQFIEAEDEIHLINPILPEFTLCGDAFDLGSDEDGYEWRETRRRTVTCPKCATVIHGVRRVRVASDAA